MIAHFALMGDLYQYSSYDTEASLWNSYPWQLGADNGLDFEAVIPAFTMAKTIWGIDDSDSSIGVTVAELGGFSMFATLIVMDNFGNFGSEVGNTPSPFPYTLIGISTGGLLTVTSISVPPPLVEMDTNSESSVSNTLIGISTGGLLTVTSMQV